MSDLSIQKSEQGEAVVLALAGKLDAKTAPGLNSEIKGLIGTGKIKLICEMSKVSYIASAGVGTLKAGLVEARKSGGDLRLAGLTAEVKDVFDVLGFSKLFKIANDVSAALQGI